MKNLLLFSFLLGLFASCTENDPVKPIDTGKPTEYNVKIHAEGQNMWRARFIFIGRDTSYNIARMFTKEDKMVSWDTTIVANVNDSLAIISSSDSKSLVKVEYGTKKHEETGTTLAGLEVYITNE